MASDRLRTLESLAMISYRVVRSLERFTNYETLFKTNSAVQKAIGALYSDLIDFCIRVVRYHSQSSLRTMPFSFDKDFRDVSENIFFHSAEIDWVAKAADFEESQKARQLEGKTRHGKKANFIPSCSALDEVDGFFHVFLPQYCLYFAEAQILFSPNRE